MSERSHDRGNSLAMVIYNLLNPVPYGFFIAGLIFDIIYLYSTNVMWGKCASWLIALGLIFAIIPRLIWRRSGFLLLDARRQKLISG